MATRGCFGHIVTHNPALELCQSCVDLDSCSQSVSKRVSKLKSLGKYAELGRTSPKRQRDLSASDKSRKTKLVSSVADGSGAMTKKAKRIYETLLTRDIDLKAGIMGNFNPITGTPRFLASAFDEVLKGGYAKRKLANKFMEEFVWTRATANSHVGICTSMFQALDLVEVDGDKVKKCAL